MEYLRGIYLHLESNDIEWIVMFIAMLFPGWLAGAPLLGLLRFTVEEIPSYTASVLPVMIIYPLIFGLFPFRKSFKAGNAEPDPLPIKKKIFFKFIPDMVILVFSIYLQVFYFDILTITFATRDILSMAPAEKGVLWFVSMAALLVIYMPARMHFFFTSQGNPRNIISMLITVILISVYAMTGLNLF